ncbi:hypothetical protein, partial [Bacteroides thetaiotaomicron]|uniref:hypothetical protein n=1 Tax=Bacteroides thetaiotaomicron TaxID=818 RepID=UPI000B26AF49
MNRQTNVRFLYYRQESAEGEAEVNPETETQIKDYTTVEGHTFSNQEKKSMTRQTLFIVDRNAHTVTGIPVEKL